MVKIQRIKLCTSRFESEGNGLVWPSERRNELLGSMKSGKGYSAIAAPFAHLSDINVNIGGWKYFHFLFWEVEKGYFRHRNKG